jgi:hypothetical protein
LKVVLASNMLVSFMFGRFATLQSQPPGGKIDKA